MIKIVRGKPNVAKGVGLVTVAVDTLERNNADRSANVELQHVTSVIECFIAVGGPHAAFRRSIEVVGELGCADAKIDFLPGVSKNGIAKSVGESSRVRFARKRCR